MRILVQVVKEASVTSDGSVTGSIGRGLLIFFGAHAQDTLAMADWMAEKVSNLRILPDLEGKMNLSIKDTAGSILIVSQFTLYADCAQGRRPSFVKAASPSIANELYERFVFAMKEQVSDVQTGIFGSVMAVSLINDGPLTFIVEK